MRSLSEDGVEMDEKKLSDYDVASMLIKMLLEKRAINDQTAAAALDKIKEMRNTKSAAQTGGKQNGVHIRNRIKSNNRKSFQSA